MKLLLIIVFVFHNAFAFQAPATQRQKQQKAAADQLLLEVEKLKQNISARIKKLTEQGTYHPVETMSWQDISDPTIVQWKATIATKYQEAIHMTIEAYDIAPNVLGIPIIKKTMHAEPFQNIAVTWKPLYVIPTKREILLPDGSKLDWPKGTDETERKKMIGLIRKFKNAVSTPDGVSLIWGQRPNSLYLAELLLHEYTHFEIYSERDWNDGDSRYDREEETQTRVKAAFGKITYGTSRKELQERQQLEDYLDEKLKMLQDAKPTLLDKIIRKLKGGGPNFHSAYSNSVPTSLEDFTLPKDTLDEIRRRAGDINNGISADYKKRAERRISEEKELAIEEEAAAQAKKGMEYTVDWLIASCKKFLKKDDYKSRAKLSEKFPKSPAIAGGEIMRELLDRRLPKDDLFFCAYRITINLPEHFSPRKTFVESNWLTNQFLTLSSRKRRVATVERIPTRPPGPERQQQPPKSIQTSPPLHNNPTTTTPQPEPKKPYMPDCLHGRCAKKYF
ncbi:MAG: hypothetical protein COB53_09815 [Elusimicrobia bacterium]|nr:MAG: hypothetical protein COB53_09815 [Elusimicrobiota bacterium]